MTKDVLYALMVLSVSLNICSGTLAILVLSRWRERPEPDLTKSSPSRPARHPTHPFWRRVSNNGVIEK